MRRLVTAAPAASAAVRLATATAHAAAGLLTIGWDRYSDPNGCYYEPHYFPARVVNETDTRAFVFSGPECTGDVVAAIEPGQTLDVHERDSPVFIGG
ncbi:hypothetical protein KGD83_20570 [Nocardiopsis akebiae]|uniref:Uncharacterized protein n=1 Tax=Nocardiopsis akebiae TaxID=2831968 RepID=A0ABX8C3J4_9ACTN|nr:hypothetical protein [Nocardiopsis akebiae]QUX27673.1 hypothetical protein KGD83_20570 [Nocardiopsis akebiae]